MLAGWRSVEAERERNAQARFQSAARRIATKISERLDAYDQMLRGAAGLFAASRGVERDEFHRYVDALYLGKVYRGIQGVGFSAMVPPGQREAFERSVRAEGYPEFRVTPPGDRVALTSILYLEPFDRRNQRAFGYDMLSEPVRREAMERARDRGEVATTARVTLLQETEEDVQPGFLTYVPVYRGGLDPGTQEGRRAALVGWIFSPMRMKDAMGGILGDEPLPFRLEIFDGAGAHPAQLLHDTHPGGTGPVEVRYAMDLPVNQRIWTLRFTAGQGYLAGVLDHSPVLDLGVGTLLVLLVTGLSAGLVATWSAKRQEEALARSLRESEARYRAIFERAPVGIFVVGPDGTFLRVNDRYCQITGWSREELQRMHWHDVIHPEDRSADEEMVARLRAGATGSERLERRGLRRDGTVFRAETTFSLERGVAGPDAPVLGVLEDVTARHDAEEQFREVAERSPAAVMLIQDGAVLYANAATAEITGVPVDRLLRSTQEVIGATVHPDDVQRILGEHERAVAQLDEHPRPISYRVVRPDGSVRKVTRVARAVHHRGRPALLLTIFDLTEQERTAEELRKTQRLESLGLLAGGIAHDFNNLLTAVFGHVEEARGRLDPAGEPGRELQVALSALARARDLTRQLLTFASGGAPTLRLLEVRRLLEEASRLALGGSSLTARIEIEPGLPGVEADEGQMSQLLSNLVVNARQASPAAAEIVLSASSRTLSDREVPGVAAGRFVEICVTDRGHGIPADVLPRVFDPFYTTRPSGTGLGLSTVFSIARRHGGHVSIESTPGAGTRVSVLIPAAEGVPGEAVATPEPSPPAAAARPGLRVLLMDDDPLVRRVGEKQLRRLGAEVVAVSDGVEAVRRCRAEREAGRRFDLLVLDLTVAGGMGGAEALAEIRAFDPEVVAVACSGYFGEGVMAAPERWGFRGALAKPYLAADLERVIRSAVPPGRGRAPG